MNHQFNDQGARDSYDLVLDIINDPDKYSAEQLQELLSDPEIREIYELLSVTRSAMKSSADIDVDAEWESFSAEHAPAHSRRYLWHGSRAASIVAIITSSLVAVAIGIAVTVRYPEKEHQPVSEETDMPLIETIEESCANDALDADSLPASMEPVVFEDESLETIMKSVAAVYDVEVVFNNDNAAGLHLYYRFDPTQPLEKVIEQLNTFERINISQKGATLTVD